MNKQALRRVGLGGFFSAVAVALVWLPAACTSSGNGNTGGASSSGASSSGAASSGGTSSSGSSSGTSSSGTSSSGTSSSGSSGSSSGTAGGDVDLTASAIGLSLRALTLVGSNLYWVDSQGSSTASIKGVPTTGGTVTTVLSDPTLNGDLTTDGTLLYFTWTSPTEDGGEEGILKASELDSVKVDGTSRTPLVTGFSTSDAGHQDRASELFLVNGNFYFVATSVTDGYNHVFSAPVAGSSAPTQLDAVTGTVSDLAYADSSGVYFNYLNATTSASGFAYLPLGGGDSPTMVYAGGSIEAGQVTVVGSTMYFPVGSGSVQFMTSPVPPTGAATALGSKITGSTAVGMIGDAQDMYVFSSGTGAGLYTLNTTTGVPTNVELDPANGDANGELRALDSKNLYFGTGSSVWAHPR